jgi:putative ABC transport system ATP-binding protein
VNRPEARNGIAVETQGLTKIYGSGNTEVVAVRDASLRVSHGELAALLGPSGSGKSTLLSAIGLVSPPTSGRVMIDGNLVMQGPRAFVDVLAFRRKHVGFVFQKANLIPFLSALENVQVAMAINDVPARGARKRAMELLDYLKVADRAHHYPYALSGGEQQRVAIARALANNPTLVLADEPTAALDGRLGHQVMELFRKVAHEQKSGVMAVTHDHRVLELFDKVYLIEDGVLRLSADAASAAAGKSLRGA